MLKKVAIGLGALVALVVLLNFALPSDYEVSRERVIDAPRALVFAQVADFQHWEHWNPWQAKDPNIEVTFGEATSGVGASYTWTSEESGAGTQTVTAVTENEAFDTDLDFGDMGTAQASFRFSDAEGGKTRVVWTLRGDAGGAIFAHMMDGWVGPDYERGLELLAERATSLNHE